MRKSFLLTCMLLSLVLPACRLQAGPQATPTPQPSSTHTPSSTPTITSTPMPTLAPSVIPLSGGTLNEEGPWLMYEHADGSVYFVNPDGTGRTRSPIKIENHLFNEIKSAGNLLSLYSFVSDSEITHIFLEVYELPALTKIQSIEVDSHLQNPPTDYTIDTTKGSSDQYWSPNGRYLAFSAIIDGPSMDLYVYDRVTNQIQRLSWGENAVGQIEWSPDSKWIVHEEVTQFYSYTVKAMWASAVDGSENKWLYAPYHYAGQELIGWVNDQSFVSINTSMDGPGYARLTNISTQESISLYEGYFGIYGPALDPTNKLLAFITIGDNPIPQDQNGLYLLYLDDPYPIFFSKDLILYEFDTNYERFLTQNECEAENEATGWIAFNAKKEISCVDPFYFHSHELSPDRQWVLNHQTHELCTYPEEKCIFTYAEGTSQAEWASDSQGFYVSTNGTLQYISVDTLTPIMINAHMDTYYEAYRPISLQWIDK